MRRQVLVSSNTQAILEKSPIKVLAELTILDLSDRTRTSISKLIGPCSGVVVLIKY